MDVRAAHNAMETFEELGYDSELLSASSLPEVGIEIVNEDLISALEIGQAYGGRLVDHVSTVSDEGAGLTMAYELDGVNRMNRMNEMNGMNGMEEMGGKNGPAPEIPGSDEGPLYDVSSEKYDHFSGDVRA